MGPLFPDPLLFAPLPSPRDMNGWDEACIRQYAIPEFTLMENASREVFSFLRQGVLPDLSPKNGPIRVLVLMGGGNNGGDGAALARHLRDYGCSVLVCHTRPLAKLKGTAKRHLLLAKRCGVPFLRLPLQHPETLPHIPAAWLDHWQQPHIVVDALLGTGFSGDVRSAERLLIRHANSLRETAYILAIDIPSGLDGLTGRPRPEAVRARATITFEAAKPGLIPAEAAPFTGEVHIRSIGMPAAIREQFPPSFRLLHPRPGPHFLPSRLMHKGTAGRVLVIGGSTGLCGAPVLAAMGALRAGAGLVTLASPAELAFRAAASCPELMTLPLAGGAARLAPHDNSWHEEFIPQLLEAVDAMNGKGALVLGPGLGRSPVASRLVGAALSRANRPPLVLDADGLYPLRKDAENATTLLDALREDDIITPHPGEAARMLGLEAAALQQVRLAALEDLTARCRAVIVLKGAGTFIGQHGQAPVISPLTAPTLAVGGSGDVLSGCAGAWLARLGNGPASALQAASLAVYLHARAGVILERNAPARGMLAGEIAAALPSAMAELTTPTRETPSSRKFSWHAPRPEPFAN